MMFAQRGDCFRIILPEVAKEIFRLMAELFEVRADGEMTIVELPWHNGPPLGHARGPLRRAKRRFVRTLICRKSLRWTLSSPRTGGVLYADGEYTPNADSCPVPKCGIERLQMGVE